MVGSSGANLFASISAGISALWGPLHGGANQAVIEMLEMIRGRRNYQKYVDMTKAKDSDFQLMGFGHRVYKNFDPRAKILKKSADDVLDALGVDDPLLDIARKLEEVALRDDYFIERNLYPNVDFYSGVIYRAMGIPTNMFTVMFALGRLPGGSRIGERCAPIPRPRSTAPVRSTSVRPSETSYPSRSASATEGLRKPGSPPAFSLKGLGKVMNRSRSSVSAGPWGLGVEDSRSDPGISLVCGLTRPCPSDEGETPGPIYHLRDTSRFRLLTHPLGPYCPKSPYAPVGGQRFVRVVRQGVSRQIQKRCARSTKEHKRRGAMTRQGGGLTAPKIDRRDDELLQPPSPQRPAGAGDSRLNPRVPGRGSVLVAEPRMDLVAEALQSLLEAGMAVQCFLHPAMHGVAGHRHQCHPQQQKQDALQAGQKEPR